MRWKTSRAGSMAWSFIPRWPTRHSVRRFLFSVCGCRGDWSPEAVIEEQVERIRTQLGDNAHVVSGLSGGVDSTVAAALVHKAIGDRQTCIFVDNGLLRE